MKRFYLLTVASSFLLMLAFPTLATAESEENLAQLDAATPFERRYKVSPGDVLSVFVWNEDSLSRPEVLVTPDGFISMPMTGNIAAGGRSVTEIEEEITDRLFQYLKDKPTVTVTVAALTGNVVSVLGKVNRPGQFVMRGETDVTQALALAGGLTTFADDNSIRVLRRKPDGSQFAVKFNYGKVAGGKDLDENIILRSGDVVVVP